MSKTLMDRVAAIQAEGLRRWIERVEDAFYDLDGTLPKPTDAELWPDDSPPPTTSKERV